jgi:hypothetical protein
LQSIAADKNQYEYETKRQQAAMAMQMAIMASKTFAGG